jgi:hypothetical protein
MDEKELTKAANQFIEAVTKYAKLDKEHDSAKIVFYSKGRLHETISYKRGLDFKDLSFICRKEKDIGEFIALLKSDNVIYDCKVIDRDRTKKADVILLTPNTEDVIKE